MFHKPSTRLASLYLAILMAISLFFSAMIYQLSVQELERGLRRPEPALMRPTGPGFSIEIREQILNERQDQFEISRDRILMRLLAINILILVTGGFLSYYLALRTLKPIEEAHEAQSRFTADASHELRTPITAMRSENEVALMNPKLTLKDAKSQLQSNIEELEKLTNLSEGLLRLAQLEHHKDMLRTDLDLDVIISSAVGRMIAHAELKKILIDTKIEDGISISGDEASLMESVVILLDNAIKYSPKASQISVSAAREHKQAIVRVADTGPGMTEAESAHVFERFYRADSSRTKQDVDGYGLGLAIAANIVERHDGTLQVESELGKGSTFIMKLPIKG